jgi:hypothetical protein
VPPVAAPRLVTRMAGPTAAACRMVTHLRSRLVTLRRRYPRLAAQRAGGSDTLPEQC